MATTAQWVFERAMALMDELSQSSGSAENANTKDYKNRTLSILNLLRVECFPFSDTYGTPERGKRPFCPEITGFEQSIGLDDGICQGALPYGLAAHLLVGEDPESAAFFRQRFEQVVTLLRTGLPAAVEQIDDLYGGVERMGG